MHIGTHSTTGIILNLLFLPTVADLRLWEAPCLDPYMSTVSRGQTLRAAGNEPPGESLRGRGYKLATKSWGGNPEGNPLNVH